MDDWLFLHEIRHRDLVREAEVARARRTIRRTYPRRRTTYRPE
ncbi:hypothetical protein [Georgenia alba]|uniref:Uncharacterized protein n=1 Tax=Georgenia alba TaxID=2233858 RepID=A0ABW2QB09_9MICO